MGAPGADGIDFWESSESRPLAVAPDRPTYRLGSLIVVIGLVGISLAALRIATGLGLLTGLAIPALIRSSGRIVALKAGGRSPTSEDRFLAFTGSLGLLMIVVIAAAIAFVVTVAPIELLTSSATGPNPGMGASLMGALAATLVGVPLLAWLWKREEI
jgi:hypothetical protein